MSMMAFPSICFPHDWDWFETSMKPQGLPGFSCCLPVACPPLNRRFNFTAGYLNFPWAQLLAGGPTGLRFYFCILPTSFIYKQ